MSAFVTWIAFGLALGCGISLFLSRNWRWTLGLLAGQYLAVFLLVQITLPLSSAAAKLVTGWMACTILAIAQMSSQQVEGSETNWPQGQWFRVLTSGIVLLVTLALAESSLDLLGISLPTAWTGFLLVGLGLLQLGVTAQPFRVVIGLLTTLAGFEIVYAGVENSALVTAFLVVINLGLAMAGSYFLAPQEEQA